jgi:glycine cleavage system pyridoxal-binding protein P
MLEAIGVASVDDLFADIPEAVRASEWQVPPPWPSRRCAPSSLGSPAGTASRR